MRRALRLSGIVVLLVAFAVEAMCLRLWVRRPLHLQTLRARRLQWWLGWFAKLIGLHIRQRGAITGAPVLVVANHISWLDIVALGSIVPLQFVAKQEVRQWPVLGLLVAAAGTLFIQRGSSSQTAQVLDEMTWSLASGGWVAVFPEGTSTDGSVVRRFHSRLFHAAIRTRVPVQALTIRYLGRAASFAPFTGDADFASHLWQLLGEEACQVSVNASLPVASIGRTARSLAAEAHRDVVGCHEAVTMSS